MKKSSLVRGLVGLSAAACAVSLAVPATAATMLPQTTMVLYSHDGDTSGLVDLLGGFNDTKINADYNGVTLSTGSASGLKSNGNGILDLTISVNADDWGFGQLIIGLNANKGSPVTITGFATRTDGTSFELDSFQYSYSPTYKGVTLFSIQNADNLFTSLTLNFKTGDSQIKELYMAGVGQLPTTAMPGVPEPAVWGMMLLGFGLVGVATRRRHRQLAVRLA